MYCSSNTGISITPLMWKSDIIIFIESAFWAKRSVCLSVCLSVLHTFSFYLMVFFPPLPKVQCPNFLDFSNLWGIEMEGSGLRFIKSVKSPCKIFFCLSGFFWYLGYYPHRLRDFLSSVSVFFLILYIIYCCLNYLLVSSIYILIQAWIELETISSNLDQCVKTIQN